MPKRLEARVNKLKSKSEADSSTSVVPIVNKMSEMRQRGEPMEPIHPDVIIPLRNRVQQDRGLPPLTAEEELAMREQYKKSIAIYNEKVAKYQAQRQQEENNDGNT